MASSTTDRTMSDANIVHKNALLPARDSLYGFGLLASPLDLKAVMQPLPLSSKFLGQQAGVEPTRMFFPVDEYPDLSLQEILELADDPDFTVLEPVSAAIAAREDLEYRAIEEDAADDELSQQAVPLTPSSAAGTAETHRCRKRRRECAASPDGTIVSETSESSPEEPEVDGGEEGIVVKTKRFRSYQTGQWSDKYEELCTFRDNMGHCLVPHTYKENLPLGRWVKRQRYQFKLLMEGQKSTLTPQRVQALEDIGFVWNSQGAIWAERLYELIAFRKAFDHCSVPSNYKANPQLATWVKCQRRQYKLYFESKPSHMTPARIEELEKLGFEWNPRGVKRASPSGSRA